MSCSQHIEGKFGITLVEFGNQIENEQPEIVDLDIKTSIDDLIVLFKDLDFTIQGKASHTSAIKANAMGRLHAAFTETEDGVYCDLHYDHKVHFLLFGVDYKKRPRVFFEEVLEKILQRKEIEFEVRTVNWFSRRNKAIFRGFRL